MRKASLLLLAPLLAACTTSTASADKFSEVSEPYFRCVVRASDRLVRKQESADILAVAATQACSGERSNSIEAIMRRYNPEIWQDITAILDRKAAELSIARIVQQRN